METRTSDPASGGDLLGNIANGHSMVLDMADVARALGMEPSQIEVAAQRAYPLSSAAVAAQHLVREFSRVLAHKAQAHGAPAALAEAAGIANDHTVDSLLKFLGRY
jgi:hypothetical protein